MTLAEHAEGHRAEVDVLHLPLEPQHGDRIAVLCEPEPDTDGRAQWMDGWLLRAESYGLWWAARDGSGEAMLTPWRKIAEVDAGWFGEGDE